MTSKKQKLTLAGQFPGNFLEALHLPQDKPVFLTVKEVKGAGTVKAADGKPIGKPIVYFEESAKGWVLNKTNAKQIARTHGGNMEKWPGIKVGLIQDRVTAFGEADVPAIRVKG